MKTNWTAGITDKARADEIRQSFKSSIVMRKRLMELLEKRMKASWTDSLLEDAYDTPNWALKQADARGYERAMREIFKLIST